ncbi:hypothetical protein SK128_018207 [Halocaridina rubra]|uniref:Uncharacterized protein n=1 Tax=Halocaridina rubra TaxID=373956 RepID=A0AAN8X0B9_HALRR
MTIVYIKIFTATRRRLRERAKASKLNQIPYTGKARVSREEDSAVSENGGQNGYHESCKKKLVSKKKKKKRKMAAATAESSNAGHASLVPPPIAETSVTENDVSNTKEDTSPVEEEKREGDAIRKFVT